MKHLRKLCAVAVLAFVLAPMALADDGIMHPGNSDPPPPPPTTTSVAADSTVTNDEPTNDDLATDVTISVLSRVVGWL